MLGILSPMEIEILLHSESVGRIGCHSNGRTYVVPTVYAYDGTAVYCLSGEGMKLDMLRSNPSACFEVETTKSAGNWRSVIAWGQFEELAGDDAERGVKLVRERITNSRQSQDDGGQADDRPSPSAVAYRLILEERTGRFERS